MKILQTIFDAGASRKARILTAVAVTAILMLAGYLSDSLPHSFGSDEMTMKKLRIASIITGRGHKAVPEDILAVNVAYDRQLAEAFDEYGIPCGAIDITDRRKLKEFLSMPQTESCKAIALDVFFDASLQTDSDSALFSIINASQKIIVPAHSDADIHPDIHPERTASSDYNINILTNSFSKYSFRNPDGSLSIASRIYGMTNGRDPSSAHKCIILPLEIEMQSAYDPQSGEKTWYNLGADILDILSDDEIERLCAGKIIVIGDFSENDMHDSYVGPISGPAVIINALQALRMGKDRISVWSTLLTVLVYLSITLILIFGRSLWDIIRWHPEGFLAFILSFIGFETLLTLLQILRFALFTELHDTFLISAILALYSLYCQKLNSIHPL